MNIDFIAGIVSGALIVQVLHALTRRTKAPDALTSFPLTTATNPAVVAASNSTAPSDGLHILVESGALTQDQYAVLSSSSLPPHGDIARLSILQNSPNEIQDIKSIRTLFKLSLRDAKAIVDTLPRTFVTPMPYTQAVMMAEQLRAMGMRTLIT